MKYGLQIIHQCHLVLQQTLCFKNRIEIQFFWIISAKFWEILMGGWSSVLVEVYSGLGEFEVLLSTYLEFEVRYTYNFWFNTSAIPAKKDDFLSYEFGIRDHHIAAGFKQMWVLSNNNIWWFYRFSLLYWRCHLAISCFVLSAP